MNHLSSSSDHLNRSHLSSFQNNPHISPPLILLLDNKNETTSQESGLGPSLRLTSNLSSVYHSTNESLGADNFGNSSHSNISEIITSVMKDDSNWDNWWAWNLISFSNLTSLFASTGMVIGGVLPYIPQYFEIKRTQNSSGFSTYVCLALIAANMLRIIFWFGKRFEIPLLIQSIVMIVAMFFMMEICLRMRRRSHNPSISSTRRGFHGQYTNFNLPPFHSFQVTDDYSVSFRCTCWLIYTSITWFFLFCRLHVTVLQVAPVFLSSFRFRFSNVFGSQLLWSSCAPVLLFRR